MLKENGHSFAPRIASSFAELYRNSLRLACRPVCCSSLNLSPQQELCGSSSKESRGKSSVAPAETSMVRKKVEDLSLHALPFQISEL